MPLALILALCAAAAAVLGLTIFGILRSVIRGRMQRSMAEVTAEGVVLDSGPRFAVIHYEGYRGPGTGQSNASKGATHRLVLTRKGLSVLGFRHQRIPSDALARYAASTDGRYLVLSTDRPVEGEGRVTIRMRLDDAAQWVEALRAAGAGAGS